MDLKASDLVKKQSQNNKLKLRNYHKELEKCIENIKSVNKECERDHMYYNIPIVLPTDPHYDYTECTLYVKESLINQEFYVRICNSGNVLYISWSSKDVEKVQKRNNKLNVKKMEKLRRESPAFIGGSINTAMDRLLLTTSLMKNNPKYGKLFSKQKNKN